MSNKFIQDGVGIINDYLKEIGESESISNISMDVMASLIDHTLLKPEAMEKDIVTLCREADKYSFKSVCINPYWLEVVCSELKNLAVKVCTVTGFPLGASSTSVKVHETVGAIDSGADEIDMVINIGALKSGKYNIVEDDIAALRKETGEEVILKVIMEICLLTPEEIETASKISMSAGAHYVKTSTGFSSGGATEEAVALMRKAVGSSLGVKASGGIRDRETAIKMIEAGATRIGTSAGIAIVKK